MRPNYPDLEVYLTALSNQLPGGKLDGSTVIPYCGRNIADELRPRFVNMITQVFGIELEHAHKLQQEWNESEELEAAQPSAAAALRESARAIEPVFITRLKCLLEKIREHYANQD